MDAENRVDGEDGKPEMPEEPSSVPPPQEGASAHPEEPGQGASPEGGAEPSPDTAASGESAPGEAEASHGGEPQGTPEEATAGEPSAQAEPASAQEAASPEPLAELRPPPSLDRMVLASLPLEQVEEDATFRIRPPGEISALATDIARLGQLFPVDVRAVGQDRYQIICGFRRVAALRFLKRDRVQARVHEALSDEDALLIALAAAIHANPVDLEELEAKREALESTGRLSAAARDMLEKALESDDSLAPESVEEEVDADELAADAAQRLGTLNQDLSLLADVFLSLDEARRAELLMQLRYSAELVEYLENL
ncbi:ParB/Srx family N-terminal domain-containing protein [Stigmatella erecta]|uniref:Chromosome segregation protein Spo0J, contains ParB-like nuclease domain n=1 Tax=Stigmatella erecta TaxID=83460 RepID=A0A1I0K4Q9_9BACT|nr:ParB/Srx family N-terminal domain-containing protein [Stigmatella erecta]SEU18702.1 Chromosome segregation protein Spo0J, contains ParB-like nuclease domain [Stigmatella erecta]